MNINCKDIINWTHSKFGFIVFDEIICINGEKAYNSISNVRSSIQPFLKLDDESYKYVEPLVRDIFIKISGSCQDDFCWYTDYEEGKVTITCEELKDYLRRFLDIVKYLPVEVQNKIPMRDFTYDNICTNLKQQMDSSPGMTVDDLARYFGQGIGNHEYDNIIKKIIVCICPSLDNDSAVLKSAKSSVRSSKNADSSSKYNFKNINITIVIITGVFVLSTISIMLLSYMNKFTFQRGAFISTSLLLLAGLIFLILFLVNPKCIYKKCS
jgi:hypothetical protein